MLRSVSLVSHSTPGAPYHVCFNFWFHATWTQRACNVIRRLVIAGCRNVTVFVFGLKGLTGVVDETQRGAGILVEGVVGCLRCSTHCIWLRG